MLSKKVTEYKVNINDVYRAGPSLVIRGFIKHMHIDLGLPVANSGEFSCRESIEKMVATYKYTWSRRDLIHMKIVWPHHKHAKGVW